MTLLMGELLKELGWSDGFRIPVANEENKKLEEEVQEKMSQKARLTAGLAELRERVAALTKHLKNLEWAQQENQGLLTAHYGQLQTEQHLAKLARAERERMQQDLRRLDKDCSQLEERHHSLQRDIDRNNQRLDKLKEMMAWDEDARLAWDEAVSRSEDDNLVLLRAVREDDHEAKDKELRRQRLQEEVRARERLLDRAAEQAREARLSLDHAAGQFRKAHAERRELLALWEDAVRALQLRDQQMYTTTQEMNVLREQTEERRVERDEQRQLCENEAANNKELEGEVGQSARTAARLREQLGALRAHVDSLAGEGQATQRAIAQAGSQLNQQLQVNAQLRHDMQAKKAKISATRALNDTLRQQLHHAQTSSCSAADRVRQLEEMVQVEERTGRAVQQDVCKLKEQRQSTQQQLDALRQEHTLLLVEVKACERAKHSLATQSRHLHAQLQRHTHMLYNLDFECQRLESRLAHVSGDVPAEDRAANQKRVSELEAVLKEKTAAADLVRSQVARLENLERRLTAQLDADAGELARLDARLLELRTAQEGARRQLCARRTAVQARQVEENVLRLRVRQAEAAVARESDHVYSLERYRLELDAVVKERQVEIEAHKEVLQGVKRRLSEERSQLFLQVSEAKARVSQLQGKHQLTAACLGQAEDGRPLSITQVMIKNAQKKYELQQLGDRLDAQIQRAEKEILALENTLKVVNAANDAYKRNLSVCIEQQDGAGPEAQEKAQLEAQLAAAQQTLKDCRSQLQELRTAVADMEGSLAEVGHTEQKVQQQLARRQQERDELEASMKEQQVKIERASRHVRRLTQQLRGRPGGAPTLEEKDMLTRELQEQSQAALQHLSLIAGLHLETGPLIKRYLADGGLSLPPPRPTPSAEPCASTPGTGSARNSVSSGARSRTSLLVSPAVVTLDPGQLAEVPKKAAAHRKPPVAKKKK